MTVAFPIKLQSADPIRMIIVVKDRKLPSTDAAVHTIRNYLDVIFDADIKAVMVCDSRSASNAADSLGEATRMIEAGEVDLVVTADICHVSRAEPAALEFIELCVRHNVRFMAIESQIDTAATDWRLRLPDQTN